jgi:hypothetical protein
MRADFGHVRTNKAAVLAALAALPGCRAFMHPRFASVHAGLVFLQRAHEPLLPVHLSARTCLVLVHECPVSVQACNVLVHE